MDRKRARYRVRIVAAAVTVLTSGAVCPPMTTAGLPAASAATAQHSPSAADATPPLDTFRDDVTIALLKRGQFEAAQLLGAEHRFARAQEARVSGVRCRTVASLVETVTGVMGSAGFKRDYDAYGSRNDRPECATYARTVRAGDLCPGGKCTAPATAQAEILEIVRLCGHVAPRLDVCDVTLIPFAGTWQIASAGLQPFTQGRDRLIEQTVAALTPLEARLRENQR